MWEGPAFPLFQRGYRGGLEQHPAFFELSFLTVVIFWPIQKKELLPSKSDNFKLRHLENKNVKIADIKTKNAPFIGFGGLSPR